MWWIATCLGCGLVYWRGSWRWGLVLLVSVCLWLARMPAVTLRMAQRIQTYQAALQISLQHPLLGVGAGPVALPTFCRLSGMPLPGPHSDLLALLMLHGYPTVGILIGMVGRLVWKRRMGFVLVVQALFLSLVLMACGRTMVVSPGYVLLVAMCSVVLLKERR